jgi:hypothetical protein
LATLRLTISLNQEVALLLRQRASELRKPVSRYLADLIREDARKQQDELAAEGYNLLSADTGVFAAAAWSLVAQSWPEY